MRASLDELFGTVRPFVPAELIDAGSLAAISQLNARLPAALTSTGGFECPLGIPDPVADWQWCVLAADGGAAVLAGEKAAGDWSPNFPGGKGWSAIRQLARHWTNGQSSLHQVSDRLWLEFDRHSFTDAAPVPSVFVSLQSPTRIPNADDWKQAAHLALETLGDAPLDPLVKANLGRCLEQLPPDAILAYVALMLSREPRAARLVIGLSQASLRDYLRRIGWPGAEAGLLELVNDVTPLTDRLFYNLDISRTISPKIGVECHLRKKLPQMEPRWRLLLDLFRQRGLCLAAKLEGLLAWTGHQRVWLTADPWPTRVFRGLHHLKVVLQAGSPPEAKGYLNVWKTSAPGQ